MTINYNDTRILLEALEQSFPPSTLLRDTFFPNSVTAMSTLIDIEYKKGGRALAPFISKGTSGVNVARTGSTVKSYEPPMMAPKRPVTVENIVSRGFGEPVFSNRTPQQRAQELIARDIGELREMNTRTMEWMCAQLMILGEFTVKGYSDDGKTFTADTVTLDWSQHDTLTGGDTWNNAGADIYGDMKTVSQTISRSAGKIPTVAICSWKTADYLLANTVLRALLLLPSDQAKLLTIAPKIISNEVIRVAYVESLNLDIYSFDGIYVDEAGAVQQYIPDDYFVMGVPGRGRQMFGAITQLEQDGVFRTYPGANVPKIWSETGKDIQEIRVASKGMPVPEFIDDWYTLKVK